MDYKLLNNALRNLEQFKRNNTFVQKEELIKITHNEEGSCDEWAMIYKVTSLGENVYVKLYYSLDSYGAYEYFTGLEFVQPVEKVIQEFKPLE